MSTIDPQGSDRSLQNVAALRKAAAVNDVATIRKLLQIPHIVRYDEATAGPTDLAALQIAATAGNVDAIEELVAGGADVNYWRHLHTHPAVFLAIKSHSSAALDCLLRHGAHMLYRKSVDEVLRWKFDVLSCAVRANFHEGVEKLLPRVPRECQGVWSTCTSCQPEPRRDRGALCPLYIACCVGNPHMVDTLLRIDKNVNREVRECGSSSHMTPLLAAVINDHVEVVSLLLRAAADVSYQPTGKRHCCIPDSHYPLRAAAMMGHLDILELLLQHTDYHPQAVDAALQGVMRRYCGQGDSQAEEILQRFVGRFVPESHHQLENSTPHLILYYTMYDWSVADQILDNIQQTHENRSGRNTTPKGAVRAFEYALRDGWWMAVESLMPIVPLADISIGTLLYPHLAKDQDDTTATAEDELEALVGAAPPLPIPDSAISELILECPYQMQVAFHLCVEHSNVAAARQLVQLGIVVSEEAVRKLCQSMPGRTIEMVMEGLLAAHVVEKYVSKGLRKRMRGGLKAQNKQATGHETEGKQADAAKKNAERGRNMGDHDNAKAAANRRSDGPGVASPAAAPQPPDEAVDAPGRAPSSAYDPKATPLRFPPLTGKAEIREARAIGKHVCQAMLPSKPEQQADWIMARAKNWMYVAHLDRLFSEQPHLLQLKTPPSGRSLLYTLYHKRRMRSSRWLDIAVEHGMSVEECNDQGKSLLHLASINHEDGAKLVRQLLNKGANVDCVDARGNTPLLCAVLHTAGWSVVKALIEGGANVKHRNAAGQTALDICKAAKHMTGLQLRMLEPHDGEGSDPDNDKIQNHEPDKIRKNDGKAARQTESKRQKIDEGPQEEERNTRDKKRAREQEDKGGGINDERHEQADEGQGGPAEEDAAQQEQNKQGQKRKQDKRRKGKGVVLVAGSKRPKWRIPGAAKGKRA